MSLLREITRRFLAVAGFLVCALAAPWFAYPAAAAFLPWQQLVQHEGWSPRAIYFLVAMAGAAFSGAIYSRVALLFLAELRRRTPVPTAP